MRRICLLLAAAAAATGCGGSLSARSGAGAGRTLSAYGTSVELPAGWTGRIVLGASGRPVLHAASSPVIGANDADDGEVARESLGPKVVYVNVRKLGAGRSAIALPVAFAASDFETAPQRYGRQRTATRDVEASGEVYRVTVVSGGDEPPAEFLVDEADALLRTLLLEPYVPHVVPTLPDDAQRIDGYGIGMRLPNGWHGRVVRGELDAASSELRLRLLEHAPELGGDFVTGHVPIELTPAEFVPEPGRAGVSSGRSFVDHGRNFVLWVEASLPPSGDAVEQANEALATLTVAPGDFYPGIVEPATFAQAGGWHTGTSGATGAKPDGQQTFTWASTTPYADTPFQFPPTDTLRKLPPDGIVITVQLYGPDERAKPAVVPFRMAQARASSFEGLGPGTPLYGLGGRVPGQTYTATVSVLFGRPQPTRDQFAAADTELARLQLPDWRSAG